MPGEQQQQLVALTPEVAYKIMEKAGKRSVYDETHQHTWRDLPVFGTRGQVVDDYHQNVIGQLDKGIPFNGIWYDDPVREHILKFSPMWSWMDLGYVIPVIGESIEAFVDAGFKAAKHEHSAFDAWKDAHRDKETGEDPVSKVTRWELAGYPTQKRSDLPHFHKGQIYQAAGLFDESLKAYVDAAMVAPTDDDRDQYITNISEVAEQAGQEEDEIGERLTAIETALEEIADTLA
jgi:hypothetical protein